MALRGRSTSFQQQTLLVEMLKGNIKLARGQVSSQGRMKLDQFWDHITQQLNSCTSGPSKTKNKWQKTWQDWKSAVKRKASSLYKYQHGIGGETPPQPLTPLEKQVLDVIGEVAVTGRNVGDPLTPRVFPAPAFQSEFIENVVKEEIEDENEEDEEYMAEYLTDDETFRTGSHRAIPTARPGVHKKLPDRVLASSDEDDTFHYSRYRRSGTLKRLSGDRGFDRASQSEEPMAKRPMKSPLGEFASIQPQTNHELLTGEAISAMANAVTDIATSQASIASAIEAMGVSIASGLNNLAAAIRDRREEKRES